MVSNNRLYFKTQPYPFQQKIVEEVVNNDIPFYGLFLDPGLGKSKIALDIATNRIEMGIVKHVWIICPTYLISNWEEQIFEHTNWDGLDGFRSYEFITYGSLSANKGLPDDLSHEDLVIIDESHYLRVATSLRHKYIVSYLVDGEKRTDPITGDEYTVPRRTPQLLTLSGTPVARDWRDLYIQMFLLATPSSLYGYNAFIQTFFDLTRKRIGGKWIVADYRPKSEESMMAEFQGRATFLKKADTGIKFPEKIFSTRYFEMTYAQIMAYNKLVRDSSYVLEHISFHPLMIALILQRNVKLSSVLLSLFMNRKRMVQSYVKKSVHSFFQICSGFVMSTDLYGTKQLVELVEPAKNPRIKLLKDTLESFTKYESVVIYTCYEYDARTVAAELAREGYTVALKYGGQTEKVNEAAINDFKCGRKKILVATIQSSNAGLNLQISSRMIYYSNSFELVQFMQGEDRIHRVNSSSDKCHYYYLATQPRKTVRPQKVNPLIQLALSDALSLKSGEKSSSRDCNYADHKLLKKLRERKIGANLVFKLFNEILTLDNT